MQIDITAGAAKQIAARHAASSGPDAPLRLKLVYDTDGCGCAVNGIAQLWLVDAPGPDDLPVKVRSESGPIPLEMAIDRQQEVFFEERVIVDYREETRSFVVKSRQQTYNPMTPLIDRRAAALPQGTL